jgi:hypothetical protein
MGLRFDDRRDGVRSFVPDAFEDYAVLFHETRGSLPQRLARILCDALAEFTSARERDEQAI